jgi:hypothetical protein
VTDLDNAKKAVREGRIAEGLQEANAVLLALRDDPQYQAIRDDWWRFLSSLDESVPEGGTN